MGDRRRAARRRFLLGAAAGAIGAAARARQATPGEPSAPPFALRYMVASCLYGYASVERIAAEAPKTGARAIDIWPKVHGSQREQLDEMGEARFAQLLRRHGLKLGCITQFKLGPFALQDEMRLAERLGCRLIVTGARGPRGLRGAELKTAVQAFLERLKPHLAVAEETGVTIAIENHGDNLIESPDAIRWLADLRPCDKLAVALSPYHLPQDPQLLARLIRGLGDRLALFYAWQHGKGCMTKLPKEEELLQLPGRGPLDFAPLLDALRDIRFSGYTEIFMHPFPRGVPIMPTPAAVTAEINRSRRHLERLLARGSEQGAPS